MGSWLPDPRTTSTSPAASSGAPATSWRCCWSSVLFVQWVRSSMREAVREDRRLDRLEAQEARAAAAARAVPATGTDAGAPTTGAAAVGDPPAAADDR